jgi:poly(3-hydroxybutyrate) depolymerase
MKLAGATVLFLVAAFPQAGTPTGDQDVRESIVSGGARRSYRVFVPDGFGRSGPGPAIVLFNGSGSSVDPLMDQWRPFARKDGVVLIGPGAFQSGGWRIPEDSPDFTHDVVEAVKRRFPIDPRRVYLFGHSGGAGHVLLLGLIESEYFAAAGAHAGALRAADAPLLDAATRKIPLAIWIGTKDQLVPLQMARDTRDVLRERGFPIALTEIKGHTHSYAERGEDVTAQAWEFLRKASLKSDPRYFKYQFNRP